METFFTYVKARDSMLNDFLNELIPISNENLLSFPDEILPKPKPSTPEEREDENDELSNPISSEYTQVLQLELFEEATVQPEDVAEDATTEPATEHTTNLFTCHITHIYTRSITGFVYLCKSCGFDLHPCCAKLPMVLDDGEVKLYLHRRVREACHRCEHKGRSWSYGSGCKKYNLHVACVRKMLVENWHELHFGHGKGSTRKLETRIPSLKNTLQMPHKRSKGKAKKCCEMAALTLQFVISAVLGDPTALIAGVIGSLMQ
ncbi:uncharacterized protein LOC120175333 [Hibiscus syriacus]|uniref:uncharacterized protein LOC120175333 n=1 Tax=Hibiscus syriacus TaxID=106335 RepID=UPI0019237ED9|nr:uncharacterized protein LOC120175333 [Hibiscus syriacus]